jgi:nucleoid DNA-binding protein
LSWLTGWEEGALRLLLPSGSIIAGGSWPTTLLARIRGGLTAIRARHKSGIIPISVQETTCQRMAGLVSMAFAASTHGDQMAAQMTKSQLIEKVAASNEISKKEVKGVLEALASIGYKELKKNGVFLLPGFAKFVVIKKPATKARKGTNPFTGEPMTFKAKPARKIVRARPVKAAKDAV